LISTSNNVVDKGIAAKIRPATLIQLLKLGFKVISLSIDNGVVMSWTLIYDNPNYWSVEKLIAECSKFKNVATVFGESHVKDEKGLDLYLNGFDCDSDYVNQILNSDQIQDPILRDKIQNLISKSGSKSLFDFLRRNTVVVETRKEFGYHFYWFSHKQNPRIRIEDCIAGREFEIKTDKGSGHSTLPPSTHRDDPQFIYSHLGRQDTIAVLDELHDILIGLLSECLKEKSNTNYRSDSVRTKTFANFGHSRRVILNDDQIKDTVLLLIDYYQEGYRNAFTFGFSGLAFKRYIAEESVARIVKELCVKTNDLETESRLDVVYRTYVNGVNGSDISARSGLRKVIAALQDEEHADKILKSLIEIWQRYEISVDSLDLSNVWHLTDEQLDKIKIPTEYVEFCINTILKEIPNEQKSVRQLIVGLCSGATHLPQNIGIQTQSGAGKNYMINKVISKFPDRDIIVLANMTPKALFHERGESVVKDPETNEYQNLDDLIDGIDQEIEKRKEEIESLKEKQQKEKLKAEIKNLEREKKSLHGKVVKLIDLDGKVLVLLDTPDYNFLTNITPILSHDRYEQVYKYVESNSGPIKTKVNVIRGFPTVIFTQACDRSDKERFVEVNRRFISISVNTSQKKVADAIALKVERTGGARGEYDMKVVEKASVYKVKLILAILMRKLKKLSKPYKQQLMEDKTLKLDDVESGTFIPFKEQLKTGLPHKQILDMTAGDRFTTNLTLLAKINADSRPKLVYSDGVVIPIATFEDLAMAMSLLYDTNNPGLSPELQQWYKEVFMEVYNDKVAKQKTREKEDKQLEGQQVSITTADLIKKHEELSKSGKSKGGYKEENSHQIHQKYLDPLIKTGYIEDERIEGRKAKLYRPIKELKYSFYSFSDEKNIFSCKLKMKVEKAEQFPTKEILELQISDSLKCSSKYSENGRVSFRLVDANGDELSIKELINRYFSNPEDYFICKDEETGRDSTEGIQVDDKEQENNAVSEHLEEHISREENDNKSHNFTQSNENNIENAHQSIKENVLCTKKEQIEYSKSVLISAVPELEESGPEYIYGNEDEVDDNQ
jgi:hypothetical protein